MIDNYIKCSWWAADGPIDGRDDGQAIERKRARFRVVSEVFPFDSRVPSSCQTAVDSAYIVHARQLLSNATSRPVISVWRAYLSFPVVGRS